MPDEKLTADLPVRPRRNRRSESVRSLVRETNLLPQDLIYPVFVQEGTQSKTPISSLPGIHRFSLDLLIEEAKEVFQLGIPALALFPVISEAQKDPFAKESTNPDGLLPRTIRALKEAVPGLTLITDVAMDPYSSDGHDGLVESGKILNDPTLEILAQMALNQAQAGADFIAPSDMMDGRVGYLREALDEGGFEEVGILAYTAKYASSFYGPFREALNSAPKIGDKKTYQMDPANLREALLELELDIEEGADIVMVKPALAYLDIISAFKTHSRVPVAAYHVSGEYAMIKAAEQLGWLDGKKAMFESLLSIKRAGADMIFTYAAKEIAQSLKKNSTL
jgi:porphobilinogen synthase